VFVEGGKYVARFPAVHHARQRHRPGRGCGHRRRLWRGGHRACYQHHHAIDCSHRRKARFLRVPSGHQWHGDSLWSLPELPDFLPDGCNSSLFFHGCTHERVEGAGCPQCCVGGSHQQKLPGMSELHSDRRAPLRFLHFRAGRRDEGVVHGSSQRGVWYSPWVDYAVRPTCVPNRVLQALVNFEAKTTLSGMERSDKIKRIAVISGDGIGKEVVPAAIKVIEATGAAVEFTNFDWSADRYLKDGTTIPPDGFAMLAREFDAIFLGALGDPRVPSNIHAKEILLGMRFKMDLYANVRPVKLLDES